MRRWLTAFLLLLAVLQLASAARVAPRSESPAHLRSEELDVPYNDRPIIGILTQPGDDAGEGESYVSAGYVKWLESAGARVVPIVYDLSKEEITELFYLVNGVFVPGGNYALDTDTVWFETGELLFNLTLEANRRGTFFPMHGHCLGLQLLATLVSRDKFALEPVDSHNAPKSIQFTDAADHSPLLHSLPRSAKEALASQPIAYHNHYYGLTPVSFARYPKLHDFFEVLAWAYDRDGVKYVSILGGRDYPITGLAFHPEKTTYEWAPQLDVPHSRIAVDVSYQLAAAVVAQARRNHHAGKSIVDEDAVSIYNWTPTFVGRHERTDDETFFEQIYLFTKEEFRRLRRGDAKASVAAAWHSGSSRRAALQRQL